MTRNRMVSFLLAIAVAFCSLWSVTLLSGNVYAAGGYYKTVTKTKTTTRRIKIRKTKPRVKFKCKLTLKYKTKKDYKNNKPTKKTAKITAELGYRYVEKTKSIWKQNGKWRVSSTGRCQMTEINDGKPNQPLSEIFTVYFTFD